jgi:hypothetical protein
VKLFFFRYHGNNCRGGAAVITGSMYEAQSMIIRHEKDRLMVGGGSYHHHTFPRLENGRLLYYSPNYLKLVCEIEVGRVDSQVLWVDCKC